MSQTARGWVAAAVMLATLALVATLTHAGAGGDTPQQVAQQDDSIPGTIERVMELIPPEHRVYVALALVGVIGWALWLRFGKDRAAHYQREMFRRPLSPEERNELDRMRGDNQ
jgi:hypothetical protein